MADDEERDEHQAALERIASLEKQNDELRRQVESVRAEVARLRDGALPGRSGGQTVRGSGVVFAIGMMVLATLSAAALMNWQMSRQAHNGGYPDGVAPTATHPTTPR